MIIKNALIYTPRHTFEEGSLTIREGRIVPFAQPEEGEEIVDAKGAYALPGLVDIHFHGAMGKDFCDGNEEAIQTLADFEAGKGVLAICPATMTFSEEILNGVMDAAAAHQNGRGADLVGINMEGPFISPNKVGAQNPEYLHKADVAMFRRLQKRANGLIKLVDIAPEEPGALEFIAACHDEVRISIAHTCTSYDTANAAFDAGATHMTHLYNAMPGITHREPGPIIAALERGGSGVRSCILHHGQHRSLGGGSPHLLVQLLQRLQIPAGEGTVDPEHLPVAQPEDAAGFLQAGGHPLQREHPAQPCQQHHGAHRTASLNLFSLPLFHPASPVFCAVPRCFFSIISHPRCNLPESRGECTSVPLAPALKTV